MIKRHTKSAIFMHWFNAICWLFLLFSGLAMLANPDMQPIGAWWTELWNSFFTTKAVGVLNYHIIVAITWVTIYLIYLILTYKKDVLPFLKEVLIISPIRDIDWCVRKGMWLILGEKAMKKMGINPELPPQGFYNAGQKIVAIVAILCSIGLVCTGTILTCSYFGYLTTYTVLVQWCLFFHFLCAGIMAIALPVHIYMAAFAPGEGPALKSMFTGEVPEEFVKHHNPLWYKKLQKENKVN